MSSVLIADTGPLIALARLGRLHLLRDLYETVSVPGEVVAELRLDEGRPGCSTLRAAMKDGWLREVALDEKMQAEVARLPVDRGEAAAILLAQSLRPRFLLMDDRHGRRVARIRGLPVVGTGGVLLIAKNRGLLVSVASVLDELAGVGYRFSDALKAEILRRAGEADPD